nr:hypothetical protein [Pseudomonas sp.]
MKVKAKATFLHDQLGRVEKGAEVEVTPAQLRQLKGYGWVQEYETKVTHDEPAKPVRTKKQD